MVELRFAFRSPLRLSHDAHRPKRPAQRKAVRREPCLDPGRGDEATGVVVITSTMRQHTGWSEAGKRSPRSRGTLKQ